MIEATAFETIISWSLRSSFLLCLIIVVWRGRRSTSATLVSTESKLNSRLGMSGTKTTIISVDQRPLFRIKEGIPDSGVVSVVANEVGPVFTRDSMLAARIFVSMDRPVELNVFGSKRVIQGHHTIQSVNLDDEKEAFQCLMQFRALKSIPSKDATWTEWNEEARKILRGAMALTCKNIAMELYDALVAHGILPDVDTFILLVKASLKAEEFRNAQFFVRKMSDSGYVAPSDVQQEVTANLLNVALNKHAAVFVPSRTVTNVEL